MNFGASEMQPGDWLASPVTPSNLPSAGSHAFIAFNLGGKFSPTRAKDGSGLKNSEIWASNFLNLHAPSKDLTVSPIATMTTTQVCTSTLAPSKLGAPTTYDDSLDSGDIENESLRHPLLVRPSGNALTSDKDLRASMGTFAMLPDSMVLTLMERLDQTSLVSLGSTCRGLFAYTAYDQLWRDLVVQDANSWFQWRGSWRASSRRLPSPSLPKVDCSNLFSDALHRPFMCSQIQLQRFAQNIPKTQQIPRLEDLTTAEFNDKWTSRPFILTGPVRRWKVYQDWCQEDLAKKYAETIFRAEAVDWTLDTYLSYMANTCDESPLYLFDSAFVEKMKLQVGPEGDFEPPNCFLDDLFTVLGEQRPDHRWLIIGSERSGSTFHKDPNATSAWNAVIRGSKYWIMFPASVIPPGVFVSTDQSEVTSPLSIAEWLLTFHAEARQTPGCVEGICLEGEVLHVPSGWWHLVVNLESSIAITQNFVPRAHLRSVIDFLRQKADQVSGFKDHVVDPFQLFMSRLNEAHPDLLVALESLSKKRKWEDVIGADGEDDTDRPGFSFGFGEDLDDED